MTLTPVAPLDQKSCAKCRFMEMQMMTAQLTRIMVCMRFPPTSSYYVAPGPGGRMGLACQTSHPIVKPHDFCHEFSLREGTAQGNSGAEQARDVLANNENKV